jgi:hypothetical protein
MRARKHFPIRHRDKNRSMLGQEQDFPLFRAAESYVRGMQRKRLQKHEECKVRFAIVLLFRNKLDEQSKR